MKTKQKTNVKAWNDGELECLYVLKTDNVPYRVIANELGRSIDSVEKKFRNTRWEEKSFYSTKREIEKVESKFNLEERLKSARERQSQTGVLKTELIADKLVAAAKALPELKRTVSKQQKQVKRDSEDMGLMLSDTHFGLSFDLADTGGLAEYNMDIAKERMANLKQSVIDIHALHSKLYDIPTLHVFSLGDLCQGMNEVGEWSAAYTSDNIMDQAMAGVETITECLLSWLEVFDNIEFYGALGNHSRTNKKGVDKPFCNFDYIAHKFIEARFSNNPRVKFHLPKAWWQVAKIRNHNFLMSHGDDIRGGGSPLNGLRTWEQKMSGITGIVPHYSMAGHFHNASEMTTNNGSILINGAVCGADMYSLKQLQLGGKPTQKLFGIHDRRGITWKYDIDVSAER